MASSAPYLGPLAQYAGEDDAEENEAGPPDTLLALPGYIRARQAALNNDIATLTEEIGNNQAILSAFSSGNRIQQDAIAKSLGMSKDEVAKMILLKQKENGLTDEQAALAAGINIETAKRLDAQASIKKSIEKITSALAPVLAVIADGIAMITGNTGGLIATFAVLAFAYLPKILKGA